jgi:hypothetical protein
MNDVQGFGLGSMEDVQNINKALLDGLGNPGEMVAGNAFGSVNYGATGAQSLRVESLDSSLKVITFTDKHINFWKDIPKSPAYSTVEEYNQLSSYGTQTGGFLSEGELPYQSNSDYARKAALVKFVGTTRSVSHPLTLVRTMVPDVIAQENSNGIMWMLRQIENSLFWGRDKGLAGAEYVEWAGLDKLLGGGGGPTGGDPGAGNTYDLRDTAFGSTPFTHIVNDLAQTVVDNFGFPTDIYIPFPVLAKINEEFAGTAAQRVILPTASGNTQVNINIDGLMTQAGRVNLKPTFFLQKTTGMKASGRIGVANAAGTGKILGSAFVIAGDITPSSSQMIAPEVGLTAGFYRVAATYVNKFGETAAIANNGGGYSTEIQSIGTVAAGTADVVSIAIGTGVSGAQFLNVYISEVQAVTGVVAADVEMYWVQQIPLTTQTATVRYDGKRLPNTYTAFIGQMTPDVITFRQLAPLVKMDLATIAPAYKWMILLYGVPVIFAPLKWTRIINIKY